MSGHHGKSAKKKKLSWVQETYLGKEGGKPGRKKCWDKGPRGHAIRTGPRPDGVLQTDTCKKSKPFLTKPE